MAKPKKVDLSTTDRDFDDLIIREYPATIFEKQHKVDDSDLDQKECCFLDLDFAELFRFLPKYRDKYEFVVRNKKGDFIEVNRIKMKYKKSLLL